MSLKRLSYIIYDCIKLTSSNLHVIIEYDKDNFLLFNTLDSVENVNSNNYMSILVKMFFLMPTSLCNSSTDPDVTKPGQLRDETTSVDVNKLNLKTKLNLAQKTRFSSWCEYSAFIDLSIASRFPPSSS